MSPRFSFLPPSCGDRLLSQASSLKLELLRCPYDLPPAGDDELLDVAGATSEIELSYEVRGALLLKGKEAAELLVALVREFRRPLRGEKGGAA